MKKQLISIFMFALLGQWCNANMASPYIDGTLVSDVFTSKDIDILNEKIHVTIDESAQTAAYTIEYQVKTDMAGEQIPLLFYAMDYNRDFHISLDRKAVRLIDIQTVYKKLQGTRFEPFSRYFEQNSYNSDSILNFKEYMDRKSVRFEELKYFEANLSKGEHVFRVEYIANRCGVRSNWVKEYSFNYSLAPAKYWRSFGWLEITIDATHFKSKIHTNLGQPIRGRLDSISQWHFNKLPNDIFTITYVPEINWFADILIMIGPFFLTLIFSIIILGLHFLSIRRYRKFSNKKYSQVVIFGGILNPFLILIFYICSFNIIDNVIGTEASRYHGYTFFAMFLYPILLSIYLPTMWKIDKFIKRKRQK